MIYKLVLTFIVLEIVYEVIELIFPIQKMRGTVKSFVLIILLSVLINFIFSLLQ